MRPWTLLTWLAVFALLQQLPAAQGNIFRSLAGHSSCFSIDRTLVVITAIQRYACIRKPLRLSKKRHSVLCVRVCVCLCVRVRIYGVCDCSEGAHQRTAACIRENTMSHTHTDGHHTCMHICTHIHNCSHIHTQIYL